MLILTYFLLALSLVLSQDSLKQDLKCKKIKCPPVQDSVCVKLTNTKAKKMKSFYIVAYNRCEVGYIKCHEGFKASTVPMRFCEHIGDTSQIHGNITKKTRVKRQALKKTPRLRQDYQYGDKISSSSSKEVNQNQKLSKKVTSKKVLISHERIVEGKVKEESANIKQIDKENDFDDDEKDSDEENGVGDEKQSEEVQDNDEKPKAVEESGDDSLSEKKDDYIEENDERPDSNVKGDDDDDDEKEVHGNSQEAMIELDGKSEEKNENESSDNGSDNYAAEKSEKQEQASGQTEENKGNPYSSEEKKLVHNDRVVEDVAEDYDTVKNEVDLDEYNKDCPSVCPSRDVMLCARCGHGIYRTFMSVCHLRVFACKHTDEKLTLVSRKPCIQSAPFLSDLTETEGRISEPNDRDKVLQFIKCREKDLLGKDPKCTFDDA